MKLNIKEGEYLVRLARSSISYYLNNLVPPKPPKTNFPNLLEKRGVFCTLLTYPENKLRGCIGLITPEKSLINATIEEIKLAKKGRIDALIREVAKQYKATLYTRDLVQALVAEVFGTKVVYLPSETDCI